MIRARIILLVFASVTLLAGRASGQTGSAATTQPKAAFAMYDGIIAGGYVDQGGYLNFTGPNINFTARRIKLILGMMPSLRFKKDQSVPANSFITPTLGAGLTFCYRLMVVQVPLYYNAKTATKSGSWHVGVGLGIRINEFNSKK